MTRQIYVCRDGDWVEIEKAKPRNQTLFISDHVDVINPQTGKHFTSKSKYYADVRARGGEIMGNDPAGLQREYKSSQPKERAGHALYRNWERMGGS